MAVHDPQVTEEGFTSEMRQQGFTQGGENGPEIDFCGNDFMRAVDGASAIVIATEWDQFVEYNYQKLT